MSFITSLFCKKKFAETVLLINVSSDTVSGAYARYEDGVVPVVVYSRRMPIEVRSDEPSERALLRALKLLGADLIREGAPALSRVTGCGSADRISVSVDAPWQEITVRTEQFESEKTFVFTKNLVKKRLKANVITLPEKMIVDESVIGTVLNGYETRAPYGRTVHRASAIVLTSLIEQIVAQGIRETLEKLFHTKNILQISGSSLRYQVIRHTFLHEHDAIILDAISRSLTSIALVHQDMFVSIHHINAHSSDDAAWVSAITNELSEMAKHHPLPRTIFLLAQESDVVSLQNMLAATHFDSLWLSDAPPRVVAISKNQLRGSVRYTGADALDISLFLMTLYCGRQQPAEENPEESA